MPPHVFNEWRANNDIPVLFGYLSTLLPGFQDWVSTLPFNEQVMARIVPTGALFKGAKAKVAIERKGDQGDLVYECSEMSEEDTQAFWKKRDNPPKILGKFEPYFKWARRTLGRKRYFVFDAANKSRTDTFLYGSWHETIGGTSNANLFRAFTVLKLGQVTLPAMVTIAPRNLDFTDLDGLTITGGWHGSYWSEVSYSSCRNMTISNADLCFFRFYQCEMWDFTCRNSKLQDFYFTNSEIREFSLSDTYAFRLGFENTRLTPFINNCELREVSFKPARLARAGEVATTFRLLRIAFQASGMRREAASCYYKERVYERKAHFQPYLEDSSRDDFRGVGYESFLRPFKDFFSGQIASLDLLARVSLGIRSRAKMWLTPKFAARLSVHRTRWLASMIESAMWGYGERPRRIFSFALLVIGVFAGLFHEVDWGSADKQLDWTNSLYFSVVTFTTLGYGDVSPTTSLLKLLCGLEAFTGAFTMGLVVAGFAGRSKY